ncbi:DBR1-domain-containing protein [Schizophyllum commune H4-8]|uniref:DBR1-domain-containing protein n=1 Tax=Schizophyllum commune (strain H4-8 / FGSC 9210) TaxID=578458 RepID=UPI00215EDC36|nr:DBR1-domain-containing protein [Schizophyllum commune H4-8]KAI5896523.1 DBR1-domain-containing protein [Schizophyllum commune H4-8]
MKIAVEGCCHGELDATYEEIKRIEQRDNTPVDVLLICGDFQAVRNAQDLQCMAVPDKYKDLRQFYQYYTGEKKAPVLTLVIGGNHEASNYMWELYHGGWLAPNIYFLGHAGCVQVNGVRIAGASGIYKSHDFPLGSYERMPYTPKTMRSIYHIREYCVRRLSLLSSPRIFLSHDWPQGIEHAGDLQGLLRRKNHFRADVQNHALGSPPLRGLLHQLQPEWWFSAHLHTRFEATVVHGPAEGVDGPTEGVESGPPAPAPNPDEIAIDEDELDVPAPPPPPASDAQQPSAEKPALIAVDRNDDEIVLSDEEEDVAPPPPPPIPPRVTKFLALDKCLPRRKFLEVIDIPVEGELDPGRPMFTFDPEWLAIVRAFNPLLSLEMKQTPFPPENEAREMVARELAWVQENVLATRDGQTVKIGDVQQFTPTLPGGDGPQGRERFQQPPWFTNPQTVAICELLGIENKINPPPPATGQ